jgi:hypothetical protein
MSLLNVAQAGSGVHPTSYPMGTGALSPGVKLPGRLQIVPRQENVNVYIHSPIRLNGVVLN